MENNSAKQQLMQLISGGWVSQAIYAAAKLNLAEHLVSGPRTVAELAEVTQCHAGSLSRLLRALSSVGLFEEIEGQRFSITEVGDCLRADSPSSARASSIMLTEVFYPSWGEILHSVQTGEAAFNKVHNTPLFDYLAENPQQATVFDAAMVSYMNEEAAAIAGAYQWPDQGGVVDIGGGSGGLIRAILKHEPQLTGTIFDLPEVAERNRAIYNSDEILNSCTIETGNFFSSVPDGADIYLMRNIIHDWDDEDSLKILQNCRKACGAGGKILLLEYVIPQGNGPFSGKWLDLMMLVGTGGRERTETEYRQLLDAAGLQLTQLIPTVTDMSIIEARPF
jgi:SAM-dependent methyltransferase